MKAFSRTLLAAVSVLTFMAEGAVLAAANPENATENPTPVDRSVMPLEEAASTDEIVGGVETCRLALGEKGKFDPKVFEDLGWRKGGTYPDQPLTEYYKLNVMNDVLILGQIDGCITKAKLTDATQIQNIRVKLIENYGLKSFDDFDGFPEGRKQHMLSSMGPSIRDGLFSGSFAIIVERTEFPNASYVSLTYSPTRRLSRN